MVEHYLFKMFHWYLLVGNFVICFWINLVLNIAFDTCSVFDLIYLFWVNSVYLLCCFRRKFFSILSLIFGWILSVQKISLISFGRKFCNLFFGSIWFLRLLLTHVLVLTWSACFGSIVFICYVVSAGSSSQLVLILSLIFGWTLSVQDVSLISFGRKFCNLFLDQFGFEYCFWYMFCFWLDLPVLGQ